VLQRVLLFLLGMLGGLLATMIGRKAVRRIWAVVDDEQILSRGRRDVSSSKLVAALALERAVFGVARGVTDRALRRAVEWATGESPSGRRATSHDNELDQTDNPGSTGQRHLRPLGTRRAQEAGCAHGRGVRCLRRPGRIWPEPCVTAR
jgi:hypothetical protein